MRQQVDCSKITQETRTDLLEAIPKSKEIASSLELI